ncbi:MAG: class I SAM-dependent methyltransferase, partial [Planctomycetota bacterium]
MVTSVGVVAAPDAAEVIRQAPDDKGLCVLVGTGGGDLAVSIAEGSGLTVFVQSPDETDVLKARQTAEAAGLLGSRVYVVGGELSHIALAPNLADALVVLNGSVDASEVNRVVRPGGKWITEEKTITIAEPVGFGQWSHPYHGPDNNPQSEDTVATGPYLTRFLAQPWYGPMPQVSVTSGGRMFKAFGHIAFKEREQALLNKLVAINSYNGTVLWERDLTKGFMVHRSTLVATPDAVYLGDDKSCKIIDAATGELLDEITLPAGLADGPSWKWMAMKDGTLYALVGEEEKQDKTIYGERKLSGWPWSGMGEMYDPTTPYEWGFGKTVVAIDLATREIKWSHKSEAPLDSRAFCMNGDSVFIYSDQDHLA